MEDSMGRHSGGGRGGMQTSGTHGLYCKCGKMTSKIKRNIENGVIIKETSIHFTRKSTYWHTWTLDGKIKRTFKMPKGWLNE